MAHRDFMGIKRKGEVKSRRGLGRPCQSETGRGKLFPVFACGCAMRGLFVVMSVLLMTLVHAPEVLAAKARQKTSAVAKPSYEQPMRLVIVRNSSPACEPTCPEWISAEGEITARTPELFRKVFKRLGGRKLPVILRSPGGSINAAIEIGQMIRKQGLSTGVSSTVYQGCSPYDLTCKPAAENKGIYRGRLEERYGFCNSACPMILAGGVERFVSDDSSVGVHEPRTVWTREYVRYRETYKIVRGKKKVISRKIVSRKQMRDKVTYGIDKRLHRQLSRHYESLGVSTAILEDTVKAKYTDINIVANARLDELRLRTTSKAASALSIPYVCALEQKPAHCVTDGAAEAAAPVPQVLPVAKSHQAQSVSTRRY
jgi:hypothetical protein